MARKKKDKSPNAINRNNICEFSNYPVVRLERCDFSKFSSDTIDPSKQLIDNKKTLNDVVSIDHETFDEVTIVLEQEKNGSKMVQPIKKLNNTNYNIMQGNNLEMNYVETSDKRNKEALALVGNKFLRVRKRVNYMERNSCGTPDLSRNIPLGQSERVPIYRKEQIQLSKSRKRKGDLYDFFPESDEDKDSDVSFKINLPVKKRKRVQFHKKIADNRSDDMKINKIDQKLTYNDKINVLLKKFAKKLNSEQENNKSLQTNPSLRKPTRKEVQIENTNERSSGSIFNSTMLPGCQKIIFLDDTIINTGDGYHISEINNMDMKETNKTEHAFNPSSENSRHNVGQDSHSDKSSLKSLENVSDRSFDVNNLNNLFGFADNIEENREEEPIDHFNVKKNVGMNGSPFSKDYISTQKRFRQNKSWRFDTNVVHRNPHFLAVKKNSLPALSQEPVLDHTFDERIDVVNKTVLVSANKKPTRQKSILNYLEAAKEYSEKHINSQSLYDIEELSPLKHKNADKENLLGKKILSNENRRSKRNILALINDNDVNNKCPLENNDLLLGQKTNSSSPDNDKCKTSDEQSKNFGFDTISEVIEDEQIGEGKPKPFRIEFTYKNTNKPKKLPEVKPVRDSEVRRLIEQDLGFEEVVHKDGLDGGELGLFEDIEQSPKPEKSYKFPMKKIRNQDTDKNKAAKVKLSKDAQKWIKQFNEMCDEVEHEVLEIE